VEEGAEAGGKKNFKTTTGFNTKELLDREGNESVVPREWKNRLKGPAVRTVKGVTRAGSSRGLEDRPDQ